LREYPSECELSRCALSVARNLFNLAVGVLWAILAIGLIATAYDWLVRSENPPQPQLVLWYTFTVFGAVGVFALARRLTPVKLNGATEETVTLSITSDTYAREFEILNRAAIVQTLPWWRG
jgi:divalent metal cation (Fe/Co/Zn/Cd) transporter